jgi:hypothetical protein
MNDSPPLDIRIIKPVSVMVTINGIAKHGTVNTFNRMDVLFAGIQYISGLKRDDPIPENMTITTKIITDVKYYGGEA